MGKEGVGGQRRRHASGGEAEAVSQRKPLWGPGATCPSSQEDGGATAGCLQRPHGRPCLCSRPPTAPPRPSPPLDSPRGSPRFCPAQSRRLQNRSYRLRHPRPPPRPHPHPRATRRPGECGLEQSRGRACSAASIEPGNLTSQASLIPDPPLEKREGFLPSRVVGIKLEVNILFLSSQLELWVLEGREFRIHFLFLFIQQTFFAAYH